MLKWKKLSETEYALLFGPEDTFAGHIIRLRDGLYNCYAIGQGYHTAATLEEAREWVEGKKATWSEVKGWEDGT